MTEQASGRPLSRGQEQRVIDFLERSFEDVESAFKKRSEPSLTTLPTLPSYLAAVRRLLAFILQIPPSTALRTAFLLRLTNDVMTSVPGYPPAMSDLRALLDLLAFLDEGWLAVLNAQAWDPTTGATDLVVPADAITLGEMRATPVSQTERARLHSMLVTGTAGLEAWLERLAIGDGEDYTVALARAGLLRELDALFSGTLAAMGTPSELAIHLEGAP